MYKFLCTFLLLFTTSLLFAQNNIEQTYRNPVISGDFPDPTVIRVGDDYYAAGTTSDFAPSYPLYHSRDLINWDRIGSVFDNPPAWIKGDCWAPELYYLDGTYYVYYTARRKSDNVTCIGVATSKDITKGFEDHGILIEWGKEAIDAYIFKDDDGKLYITWKAYGLNKDRPIEILGSELSADGLSLVGEHFTLTHHDKGWKGYGDEGQCIVKHNGYYYLIYSAGGCCDNRCDYHVQVARSKTMKGVWEQYDQNPILEGGELWRCSGHGTLVETQDNRYFYLYHAYHAYDFEFVGRQGLLDELLWNEETGWPYFRYGRTPSAQAQVPFKNTIQYRENATFYDNFATDTSDKFWLWDMNLPKPILSKDNGKLTMTASSAFVFRGVNAMTGNYIAETGVRAGSSNFKGLSVYGNRSNMFSWGVEGSYIKLYKLENDTKKELFSIPFTSSIVYLKVESKNGRLFSFYYSDNQKDWKSFSENDEALDGKSIPQWGKGVRIGLLVENNGTSSNSGEFSFFSLENKY